MSTVQAILDDAIEWKTWTSDAGMLAFLTDLQSNILKGHGRDYTANIFLSFEGMPQEKISALLQTLSYLTTSALDQLRAAAAYSATKVSGGRVLCVFLTANGYQRLGVAQSDMPADLAFRAGMQARGALPSLRFKNIPVDFPGINDPARSGWERGGPWDPGKGNPDAMVLIADDDAGLVSAGVNSLKDAFMDAGVTVLGVDRGEAQRRRQLNGSPKGEGLEHFGYVDGVSQPLFLVEDFRANPAWSEAFVPSQFIVPDPAKCTPFSCGSYFVYRKLEQNVQLFKKQEEELAAALKLTGNDEERAGALVVGRFEDGTPVALHPEGQAGVPTNDFNYAGDNQSDPLTATCPFKAHIRKTNPRTAGDDNERAHIMARRGITYGKRNRESVDEDFSDHDQPTGKVGLLFMAYMSDIAEQFEFTQSAWANNTNFKIQNTGVDPVIGQQPNGPADIAWTDAITASSAMFDFKAAVKLMGGAYFFAPSISFLQKGQRPIAVAALQ
ncbi:Dyp-type peroxidase [Rhizobium sp. 18055]|uniref:Dyp-type peroxidase n=1 Tax=Rhizobium sp. 18055 TaxID=2681403 RepID=UPI00135CE962|nr:Dyp-type peroxidase [Rhizobium sp. 18055]